MFDIVQTLASNNSVVLQTNQTNPLCEKMKFSKVLPIFALVAAVILVEECHAKNNIIDINRMGVFKVAVLRNLKPVVVYYTKSSCFQCRKILLDLENLARANDEIMYLARVDLDQYPELYKEFDIKVVPTTRTYYRGTKLREVGGPLDGAIRAIANHAIKTGESEKSG